MSYTLEDFSQDCRKALEGGAGKQNLEQVRQQLENALKDPAFVKKHLGPDNTQPRTILYEDPTLKFCIVAHVYSGAKGGAPHDHGPTWAIYGQAEGVTEMTEWRVVEKGQGDEATLVEPVETYELKPGMARVYAQQVVHSPKREASTKLVRIEGSNLDHVSRSPYKSATVAAE